MEILSISPVGYGHKRVTIEYRGKQYSAITTNTHATDRLQEIGYIGANAKCNGYTQQQAVQTLIDEVLKANNLK